jgi:hypothetical protein
MSDNDCSNMPETHPEQGTYHALQLRSFSSCLQDADDFNESIDFRAIRNNGAVSYAHFLCQNLLTAC